MDADWVNDEPQLSAEMAELKASFFQQIAQIKRQDILEKIIELDADFGMPFDIIQATCEKLGELKSHKYKTQHYSYPLHFSNGSHQSNKVKI